MSVFLPGRAEAWGWILAVGLVGETLGINRLIGSPGIGSIFIAPSIETESAWDFTALVTVKQK